MRAMHGQFCGWVCGYVCVHACVLVHRVTSALKSGIAASARPD